MGNFASWAGRISFPSGPSHELFAFELHLLLSSGRIITLRRLSQTPRAMQKISITAGVKANSAVKTHHVPLSRRAPSRPELSRMAANFSPSPRGFWTVSPSRTFDLGDLRLV